MPRFSTRAAYPPAAIVSSHTTSCAATPGGRSIALVNYAYTGHSYGSYLVTDTNYYNPSYGVVNASVGYRFGANQLTLYVKNLLNNETIIQRPEINTVTEGYTVHPRTIGLSLKLVD